MGDWGLSENRVAPNPIVYLRVPYLNLIVDQLSSLFSWTIATIAHISPLYPPWEKAIPSFRLMPASERTQSAVLRIASQPKCYKKDGKRDEQFDITWHNLTTLPQRRASWNEKFNCIHPLVIKHGRNIRFFIIRLGWGRIGWGSNVHEIYSIRCTGCYARIDIPMVQCMDFTKSSSRSPKCMYVCKYVSNYVISYHITLNCIISCILCHIK